VAGRRTLYGSCTGALFAEAGVNGLSGKSVAIWTAAPRPAAWRGEAARCYEKSKFASRFKLIWAVQYWGKKYIVSVL
jgi:hypothetical protein